MNNISTDNRGTIRRHDNILAIDNALIEEVFTNDGKTGYIIISYAVKGRKNVINVELLRLNVNKKTIIKSQSGLLIQLCDIKTGMWVDAEFSPVLTRSIPPQSNAFRIVVRQRAGSSQPPAGIVTKSKIVKIDNTNNFLITGNRNNINQQMRFVITNETVILNKSGSRIALSALRLGQTVEVTHADFQTMSLPPQTTAFRVQVL